MICKLVSIVGCRLHHQHSLPNPLLPRSDQEMKIPHLVWYRQNLLCERRRTLWKRKMSRSRQSGWGEAICLEFVFSRVKKSFFLVSLVGVFAEWISLPSFLLNVSQINVCVFFEFRPLLKAKEGVVIVMVLEWVELACCVFSEVVFIRNSSVHRIFLNIDFETILFTQGTLDATVYRELLIFNIPIPSVGIYTNVTMTHERPPSAFIDNLAGQPPWEEECDNNHPKVLPRRCIT
jgi:hypothetical protein